MEKTLSDAINIQVPYNMERIFFYLTGEDAATVSAWMSEMDRSGRLTLPALWLDKLREVFDSRRVDDDAMCAALRRAADEHNYLADPHTAVALSTAWDVYGDEVRSPTGGAAAASTAAPVVVLATASPCKFEASLTAALGPSRWWAYAQGPDFPAAARQVLATEERPFAKLAGQGALEASQAAWEAEVRGWLDRAGEADTNCMAQARAKL